MRLLKRLGAISLAKRKAISYKAWLNILRLIGFIAVSGTSCSALADATRFTGHDVLKYCVSNKPNESPKPGYDQDMTVFCWANFQATLSTALLLVGDKQICLPKGSQPTEVLFAAVKYLKAHPEYRDEMASSIYVGVMKSKWPCSK